MVAFQIKKYTCQVSREGIDEITQLDVINALARFDCDDANIALVAAFNNPNFWKGKEGIKRSCRG